MKIDITEAKIILFSECVLISFENRLLYNFNPLFDLFHLQFNISYDQIWPGLVDWRIGLEKLAEIEKTQIRWRHWRSSQPRPLTSGLSVGIIILAQEYILKAILRTELKYVNIYTVFFQSVVVFVLYHKILSQHLTQN